MMQNDDLSLLGGAPGLPLGNLNLAGSDGVPDPQELLQGVSRAELIQPDYGWPDLSIPDLSGGDLAGAPLTMPAEFAPDPLLPDLTAEPRPFALDLYLDLYKDQAQNEAMDTADLPADLSLQGWPGLGFNSLQVIQNVQTPDPLLPDLQHPDLTPQVTMPVDERPGDLDPEALDVMHQSLRYQQLADKHYPEVYADQHGVNDRRSREMTLLMKGLDAEEQGREL